MWTGGQLAAIIAIHSANNAHALIAIPAPVKPHKGLCFIQTMRTEMKMPKAIKRKWLRALRSGTYKQARGTLYKKETAGFCCLGVLQHCVSGGMVEVEDDAEDFFRETPSPQWYKQNGIVVAENVLDDDDQETLMKMNDGQVNINNGKITGCKGFKVIADWIEKNIGTTD